MKKRLIIYLLVLLGVGSLKAQTCLPDGITITNQAQIDSFVILYPDCSEILGDLIIDPISAWDITDFSPFNQVTTIGGNFTMQYVAVTSFAGLDNLSIVEGDFEIKGAHSLVSLSGLNQLERVGGVFDLYNNYDLLDLSDLESLTVVGELRVFGLRALVSLSGLEPLDSVLGDLKIEYSDSLVDVTALESLSYIGDDIWVRGNDLLADLPQFSNIDSIYGDLWIQENPSLTNLSDLNSIISVGGLKISTCEGLTNLSGLENLENIGVIHIGGNPNLTSLLGLGDFNSTLSSISISFNPLLTDLTGLEPVTEITGWLAISENLNLQSLAGLNNLVTVQNCRIHHSDGLLNLEGLNGLTNVIEDFEIEYNDSLINLSGLSSLESVGQFFRVASNPRLQNFVGVNSLENVYFFTIHYNESLESTLGLESLTYVNSTFRLQSNVSLLNLAGLENLTSASRFELKTNILLSDISALSSDLVIDSRLEIVGCNALEGLSGIADLTFSGVTVDLILVDNDSLSLCGQENICDFILTGGNLELSNNAPGCNTISELLLGCYDSLDYIIGNVIGDINQNCIADPSEDDINNWLVEAYNDDFSFAVSTDSAGNYLLPLIEGEWYINGIAPSSFWASCFADSLVVSNANNDTTELDIVMSPQALCPFIDWDMNFPLLRIGTERIYSISYCNYGSLPGEDLIFAVNLDDGMILQSASVPFTIEPGGTILFELEPIEVFDCERITFRAFIDTVGVEIGDLLCVDVEVLPDDLCSTNTIWDESTIEANGYCAIDSIYFELQNIGSGNMTLPNQFRVDIVIDDIVLLHDVDDYQLESGESFMFRYALDGSGMRLETEQPVGHPIGDQISFLVPNCEDIVNNTLFELLPTNNGNPFQETYCRTVIGACDPNLKYASPAGIGDFNEIDKSWTLDYTIQFQNVGTDTAFLVVVKDTISENLDLSTLKVGGGSDPFTWSLNPGRELVFTFENILLPDSTTNESASHGLVAFSIDPRSDLLPGDSIKNRVGIYFDFNDPVITNTVFHTIRKPVVATSEHVDWCTGEEYAGIEIWQDTSIQLWTEFIEYDSVHFLHLDVLTQGYDSLMVDAEIGSYFENVLIEGDTVFTVSYSTQNNCDSLVTYTITGLTDISELPTAFKSVQIFPNPVDDFLQVLDHQTNESQQWELVDNLGQVIWKEELQANQTLSKISMLSFSPGVYLLTVKTATATAVWKVVRR